MYLKHLHLKNFRNHLDLSLDFHAKVNVIAGDNGIGKTNILEAIHFLSTGKSFRTCCLDDLICQGCSFFYIQAQFVKENIEQTIKIGYEKKKKHIEYNFSKLHSFSNLLGILPSVIFAPKDISLVMGVPSERRRFLNIYLSQIDPLYVHYLQRYSKCLEQRNFLLKSKKPLDPTEMRCFENELSIASTYLIKKRVEGIEKLSQKLKQHIKNLTDHHELFDMKYHSSFAPDVFEDPKRLAQEYEKIRHKEKLLGSTLLGPHREDFGIYLEKQSVKSFCSEGQKRSFLTALKLAEWELVASSHLISPLLCIDDLGVHLDEKRHTLLEQKLMELGQVFITSPKNTFSLEGDPKLKVFQLRKELQIV
jgi:DNA replication and repair protein RecF